MADARHEIAQYNVARAREPLDAPLLAEFVAALAPVNAAADDAPGFRWRLTSENGADAAGVQAPGADGRMIVNLSVWESLDALRAFVHTGDAHRAVLRRRREWFERLAESAVVLWWVPAGHRPSVAEAHARLEELRSNGTGARAFGFRDAHAPPGACEGVAESPPGGGEHPQPI